MLLIQLLTDDVTSSSLPSDHDNKPTVDDRQLLTLTTADDTADNADTSAEADDVTARNLQKRQ